MRAIGCCVARNQRRQVPPVRYPLPQGDREGPRTHPARGAPTSPDHGSVFMQPYRKDTIDGAMITGFNALGIPGGKMMYAMELILPQRIAGLVPRRAAQVGDAPVQPIGPPAVCPLAHRRDYAVGDLRTIHPKVALPFALPGSVAARRKPCDPRSVGCVVSMITVAGRKLSSAGAAPVCRGNPAAKGQAV
jgi:hypothetical protein